MVNEGFKIRFWGVRGSYPTPGPATIRYGGNTSCVEVSVNGHTLIFDSGTGIIGLGKELARRARQSGQPVDATLLLSHLHHDHTQGFPFFLPALLTTARLTVLGPDFMDSSPLDTLSTVMKPPYFPVSLSELNSNLTFGTLREKDILLMGESVGGMLVCSALDPRARFGDPDLVRVRVLRSYAHPNGVLHYRVDWRDHALVYATDTEGYVNGDRRLAGFALGADVLIHDAQYTDEHYLGLLPGIATTQGFGHSTTSIAIEAARAAQAGQLVLFHHAPEYDDDQLDRIAAQVETIQPGTVVAREGLEIEIIGAPIPVASALLVR